MPFTTQNYGLSPQLKRDYFDAESSFMNKDADILLMKRLRNNLEAYSYEMRNNLDSYGPWEKYLDEETKKSILTEINQVVDWLYAEGENAPIEEYQTRLDKFMKIGEPVKARHFYYGELDIYFQQFETLKQAIAKRIASMDKLTEEQKNLIGKKVEEAQKFMDSVKADRESKQLYENPAFNLD